MGIRDMDGVVAIDGIVAAEDAETLLELLRASPRPAVDLAGCTHLHAAALQVLLALRPLLRGPVADPWLRAALRSLEVA